MKISKLLFILILFFSSFIPYQKIFIYFVCCIKDTRTNFTKIMPGCNIKNIHDETNDQLVAMRISVGRLDPLEGDEQLPVEKINTFAWGSVS